MLFREPHMQENDSQLWERFRNGDVDAFGELSQLHYRLLYNYGLKFSLDSEFIKDCIQDLYLDLWERRSRLSQTAFVKSYLLKALRHRIIKENIHLKRFREPDSIPFELNESELSVEMKKIEEESIHQQVALIKKSISLLTRRQKEIIYLRYYQDMSYDQIASIMNISSASVATLHYRTLQQIKSQKIIRDMFIFLFAVIH